MAGLKRIGVLTSGGDSPGMNAAIRAVVRAGLHHGMEVVGVLNGYKGLLEANFIDMNYRTVSEIMSRGGTILKTARCLEFMKPEGVAKAIENAKNASIEGIVAIGGDGTFKGARDLSNNGLLSIGLPGTIDNDISCTDYTIGFDTALNTACEAVDKLKDTCASHNRCSVIEVMGRHAGHIALYIAIANGAEAYIIPEKGFDFDKDVVDKLHRAFANGKSHFIVIVAEGAGKAEELAKRIEWVTGIETRASVLGHLQRGGGPTVLDRIMASRMGAHAVELFKQGIGNRVVGVRNNKVVDFDINEALAMTKGIEEDMVNIAFNLTE